MKTAFTLIEVVATLLLVAILAVSVAISLLPMAQGLMQVRDNTAAAQKARLAMARIAREFTTITNVVSSGSGAITYDFLVPNGNWYAVRRHTLSWSGSAGAPLLLEGVPLSDDVANFSLSYAPGPPPVIGILLQSQEGGQAFRTGIAPRNMGP